MHSLHKKFDPDIGPLITVTVATYGGFDQRLDKPIQKNYLGLIDTGTSNTCVSSQVISDLKLEPTGKYTMAFAHYKPIDVNSFYINMFFPFPHSVKRFDGVLAGEFVPPKANETTDEVLFHLLIGRDILSKGHLMFSQHNSFRWTIWSK